jgi:esterase/lipase
MDKPRNDNQGIVLPPTFSYSLKVLDFLHPYLSMRLAAFFFAKPFRYKLKDREIPILSQAQKSFFKIKKLGKTICCYHWKGKGTKVMLVHGWSGRASNFYKIIEALKDLNCDVYAFDAPAHGKSQGLTTNLQEFIVCLETLLNRWGTFDIILGHSGGGFSSAYVCARRTEIKKLILISPFDRSMDLFEKYYKMIGLGKKAQKLMYTYFFRKMKKDISEFSSSISAQSINSKTLIIHDENDREVELYNSININENLQKGKLFVTKGLGHRRILRTDIVIDKIVSFLRT